MTDQNTCRFCHAPIRYKPGLGWAATGRAADSPGGSPGIPSLYCPINSTGQHAPEKPLANELAGVLAGVLAEYAEPVSCTCGRSWGPGDAIRVMRRSLRRNIRKAKTEQENE